MNFSFKNLSIKVWIVSNVTLLLLLMLGISLYAMVSLTNIGRNIQGLTTQSIPIIKNVADIKLHQLEQKINFEHALNSAQNLIKKTSSKEAFEKSVTHFNQSTSLIDLDISKTKLLLKQLTQKAFRESKIKDFSQTGYSLQLISKNHKIYAEKINQVLTLFSENKVQKTVFLLAQAADIQRKIDTDLTMLTRHLNEAIYTETLAAENHEHTALLTLAILVILAILSALALTYMALIHIITPLNRIQQTVHAVTLGNLSVRTAMDSTNEFGQVALSLDNLLNDRLDALATAEKSSSTLNTSIIGLLHTVAALSQKDLTVQAVVTEDVAGTVADALNQLTTEMASVLHNVDNISGKVSTTSNIVKSQSDLVSQLAVKERQIVDATSDTLKRTTVSMQDVASLTERSNRTAELAIASTDKAFSTVANTVQGINDTRDTIRETEKRIKRLGERSQEINSAVNLINTIAERTHILALNASMQAASAGEAGRGFAVVADEVQRLAESSRDATAQIATLVKNIQVETSETVKTMNDTITQVVAGSRLAQQAGTEMQATQVNTSKLVAQVQEIAEKTLAQVSEVKILEESIAKIRYSTVESAEQLNKQSTQTSNLVGFSDLLVEAVHVFTLPKKASSEVI